MSDLKKSVEGEFTRILVEPNGPSRIQYPQMFDRSNFEVLLLRNIKNF